MTLWEYVAIITVILFIFVPFFVSHALISPLVKALASKNFSSLDNTTIGKALGTVSSPPSCSSESSGFSCSNASLSQSGKLTATIEYNSSPFYIYGIYCGNAHLINNSSHANETLDGAPLQGGEEASSATFTVSVSCTNNTGSFSFTKGQPFIGSIVIWGGNSTAPGSANPYTFDINVNASQNQEPTSASTTITPSESASPTCPSGYTLSIISNDSVEYIQCYGQNNSTTSPLCPAGQNPGYSSTAGPYCSTAPETTVP
jgi:hypothetical protein